MIGFALPCRAAFNPPVLALAWAVTVGGVLQLLPASAPEKIGMLVLPRINFKDAGARVIKQMGPAILVKSVS